MTFSLLLDEDSSSRRFAELLRAAGHDVVTALEARLEARHDADVLSWARAEGRVLLTHNCDDFRSLHEQSPHHSGIMLVYRQRDPAHNLTYEQIVRAIANVQTSGWDIANELVELNAWNY
jgi:predicted nuclease of predicted toxin-antitoxin system